jgi:hypothetical protein
VTERITFSAEVNKVQTLADGGIRVTFDLPESEIMQMAQLAECKRWGAVLTVECVTLLSRKDQTDEVPERPKRKSEWTTPEKPGAD